MTDAGLPYAGTELELFSAAGHWRGYWTGMVRPFLGANVLEVGAGIGSTLWALGGEGTPRWLALEPDAGLAAGLAAAVRVRGLAGAEVICATLDGLETAEEFDSVLYIDVLEHIAEDAAELRRACARLKRGGHLIVLAPAHQFLFSPFDAAIGHHRRYGRRQLRTLRPEGCAEVFVRYLDCVGLLASLGNRLVLQAERPNPRQIAVWDGFMVPVSRVIDPLLGFGLGKSLLAVWRKT